MAENTLIEWCKHTLNLWWGCIKVHKGCDGCYAETWANRFHDGLWGKDSKRRRIVSAFKNIAKFQKMAAKAGEQHTVFLGSMMDIFEKPMPLNNPTEEFKTTGDLRDKLFSNIEGGMYPNIIFLLLTKRPSNIAKYAPDWMREKPLSNIWFGTSPADQKTYDTLAPHMAKVVGNKFLSVEPQVGNILLHTTEGIRWIIQGGESGNDRRPFELTWADNLRHQCQKVYGIPYFFKQIDKKTPIPDRLLVREFPEF